jgi:MYXO-CTERM domain-containing protein
MQNSHTVVKILSLRRRLALALLVMIPLVAGSAFAADRVVWKRRTVQEVGEAWKIALQVHLSRAPDIAHMPVRFTFTPTTYFERALVDGRKEPVIRKVPLRDQQPIVESVDVGFMDPATGKTAARTRFSFQVTRERGFSAGQYDVKVTNSRSGKQMGPEVSLTLEGENEVIDRRSIVFDEKTKKADDGASKAEKKAAESKPELTPDDDAFWAGGQAEEKRAPLPPPAHLQEKPGCGCRVAGDAGASGGLLLTLLLPLGLAMRRRRRVC